MYFLHADCRAQATDVVGGEEKESNGCAPQLHRGPDTEVLQLVDARSEHPEPHPHGPLPREHCFRSAQVSVTSSPVNWLCCAGDSDDALFSPLQEEAFDDEETIAREEETAKQVLYMCIMHVIYMYMYYPKMYMYTVLYVHVHVLYLRFQNCL